MHVGPFFIVVSHLVLIINIAALKTKTFQEHVTDEEKELNISQMDFGAKRMFLAKYETFKAIKKP